MALSFKRLFAAVMLGAMLAFGAVAGIGLVEQPDVMQVADPGGGNHGNGG